MSVLITVHVIHVHSKLEHRYYRHMCTVSVIQVLDARSPAAYVACSTHASVSVGIVYVPAAVS